MTKSGVVSFVLFILLFLPALVTDSANVSGTSTDIDSAFAALRIQVVDLDADGDLDVVGADPDGNELAWYQNTGSMNFTKRSLETTWDAVGVAVADIDKDNDLDIVATAATNGELAWWQNDGTPADGGWTKNSLTSSLTGVAGVAVADIDGDTNPDIVSAALVADRLDWWQNDGTPGDGGWTQRAISAPNGAVDLLVYNFDSDTDLDVVATAREGDLVGLLENDGTPTDGGWTTHLMSTTLDGPVGLDRGDIDGDGDQDIVVAAYNGDQVVWYQNDGTINAQNWTEYSVITGVNQAYDVDVGDLDNDGVSDIGLASYNNTSPDTTIGIQWLENDGTPTNGGWTQRSITGASTRGNTTEIVDFDLDGDRDMVYGRPGTGLSWIKNTNVYPELISGQITNLDSSSKVYAKRSYTFQIVAYDGNGASDIDKAYLRLTDSGSRTHTLRWDNDAPTSCDIVSNPSIGDGYMSVGSCSASTSGNQLTVTFSSVKFDWDFVDSSNMNLEGYVEDDAGFSAGYTTLQSSYFSSERDVTVVSSAWAARDATINPSTQGVVDYTVTYEGASTISPPDSEIASVRAMRDDATDTDITAAAGSSASGSITLNTISTLGASTMSPRIAFTDGEYETLDIDAVNTTVTVDRVKITGLAITNHLYDSGTRFWDDNNGSEDGMTLTVNAILENANTALTGGNLTLGYEGNTSAYGAASVNSSGVATKTLEEDPASGAVITRDNLTVASVSEGGNNTYGTEVNLNGTNTLDIGWDHAPPQLSNIAVSESSSSTHYDSATTTFYFSNLMSSAVSVNISGTATDTGSGLGGDSRSKAAFSSESSLASSPSDDLSPDAFAGIYGVDANSTAADSPVVITVTDNVGNSATRNANYIEDTTAPTYTLATSKATLTNPTESLTVNFSDMAETGAGTQTTYLDVYTRDSGTPTTARSTWTITPGELDDASYYFRGYAVDNVGNAGSVASTSAAIDYVNENPRAPANGFDPADDVAIANTKPTLRWSAATDPDPSDTAATLIYTVCLDNDGEVAKDCSRTFATAAGVTSQAITTALAKGEWSYAVKTTDTRSGVSGWSDVQTFTVDPSLAIDFAATKTVGINVGTTVFSQPSSSTLASWAQTAWALTNSDVRRSEGEKATLAIFGQTFLLERQHASWLSVLSFSRDAVVNYVMIGFAILAVGYAFGALSQRDPIAFPSLRDLPRHIVRSVKKMQVFFTASPAKSFHTVAPRTASGTWLYSYAVYQRHHRLSRFSLFVAAGLFAVKLVLVLVVSGVLIANAHRVVGASPLRDDGRSILPGDVLTYRIDYTNSGTGAATGTVITDVVPTGTTYIDGSSKMNGSVGTDTADTDSVTLNATTKTLTFNIGTVNVDETGFVEYRTRVNEPSYVTSISNTASMTSSEVTTPVNTNTTSNALMLGSIGDLVWHDEDRDGEKDNLESGLQGVEMTLYKDQNSSGALEETDTVIGRATTEQNGRYVFDDLGIGRYFVDLNETTLPSGYLVTTSNDPLEVNLSQSQDYLRADFGAAVGGPAETPEEPSEETPSDSEQPTEEEEGEAEEEVPSGAPEDQPEEVEEEVQSTITLQDIKELNVPEKEKEILQGFTLEAFGTPTSERLLETAGKLSIETREDVIVLRGRAKPKSVIEIFIFSDPVRVTGSADQRGQWEVEIAVNVLDPGTHRVVAQVTDPYGRTSSQIEVAQIVIEKEELSQINVIIYIVLVVIIVVMTAIVVSLIYKRDAAKFQNRWQGLGERREDESQ